MGVMKQHAHMVVFGRVWANSQHTSSLSDGSSLFLGRPRWRRFVGSSSEEEDDDVSLSMKSLSAFAGLRFFAAVAGRPLRDRRFTGIVVVFFWPFLNDMDI